MATCQHLYTFNGVSIINYRKIDNIRGFTKETLVAVTTNIESREWRRQLCQKPEHPRSGTSDDVECLFSVMRDTIGQDFTTKHGFRKVLSSVLTVTYLSTTTLPPTPDFKKVPCLTLMNQQLSLSAKEEIYLVENSPQLLHLVRQLCQ